MPIPLPLLLPGLFVAAVLLAAALSAVRALLRRGDSGGSQGRIGQSAFDGTLPSSPRVAGAFSPNVTPELSLTHLELVQDLLRQHEKIPAIKLYKEQTGVGLKEAKDAVEAIERGLSEQLSSLPPQRLSPQSAHGKILAMALQGQKIQAIKLYREQTGVGLKEAKDAIEAIGRGEDIGFWTAPLYPSAPLGAGAPDTASLPLGEIRALLRQNRKIEAIKLYRERSGVGLKDAKDAVEAIERAGL